MQDLRTLLSDQDLHALRADYDLEVMSRAASGPFEVVYPPIGGWTRETSATFFDRSTLSPKDRERCIVALLAMSGIASSFAIHIYWGLMEGLSLDDVCQTISLVGVYGGIPKVAWGMTILQRIMILLRRCVEHGNTRSDSVVETFLAELR